MGKLTLVALVVAAALAAACKREGAQAPSPLQDGAVVAKVDAAPAAVVLDAAPIAAPPTAAKVVVGPHAACAVMSDHTVRCWGAGGDGQLGDGQRTDSAAPVEPAIRGVQDLVLGDDHACALLDDSSVACWGKIAFGPKPGPTLVPTGVPGAHDMVRVFAVGGASCSTAKDGALVCWGDVDARGHVTATGAHHTPTPVTGVDHVTALVARAALRDDGDVSLWLDDGAPVRAGVTGMTELATRDAATCALGADGLVRCFGAAAPCAPPKVVAPPSPPPSSPHRGRGHGPRKAGLAAAAAAKAKAAGASAAAMSSPSPSSPSSSPPLPSPPSGVAVASAVPLSFGAHVAHLAFDAGVCAITTAKQLVCVDIDHACKLERPWPALVTVAQSAGTCARLANGTIRCGASGGAAPVIAGISAASQLAASQAHGCAILANGCLSCWTGTVSTTTTCGP